MTVKVAPKLAPYLRASQRNSAPIKPSGGHHVSVCWERNYGAELKSKENGGCKCLHFMSNEPSVPELRPRPKTSPAQPAADQASWKGTGQWNAGRPRPALGQERSHF